MRLGAVFPQGQFPTVDPDAVVRLVQRLEAAGYDHLLVYDHVLAADISNRPDWTGYYSSADPFLEPLVLFAYVARACSLELVTDVLVAPQRQTALLAKQVATLALLAPGRGAVARVGRLADGWLPEPTVQPGRGFEPAWLEVRAAASAAGRDPDALGLEGQLWSPPDQESRLPDRLAQWRDAGADAVGINTGRAGVPWSEEHLEALLRAADAMP